jgi:hypothetical protein
MEELINTNEELRTTFIWAGDQWLQADNGLCEVKAGEIFYMREPTGEIVENSKGYQIFVATKDAYLHERWTVNCVPVAKGEFQISLEIDINNLAEISDKALDDVYHYGRSVKGNNFGWLANVESAKAAYNLISKGETDIEIISDAIHSGWNNTAMADYNGDLSLDTPTPNDKKEKRRQLANLSYNELPEDEKEKDRVVARALLEYINLLTSK